MNYYEIVGPSGSGKTTLFNVLKERDKLNCFKQLSILPYIIKSNKFGYKKALIYKYLMFAFPYKTFERLKSRLYYMSREHQEALENDFGSFYFILMEGIKKENPVYINQVLNDYLSTLMTIHLLDLSLSENDNVILDEGFLHKNLALRDISYPNCIFDRLKLHVKGVIYLNTPGDLVYEQCLKRFQSGHKTLSHKFLDPNLLRVRCDNEVKRYNDFIEKLRILDVPVLEIRDYRFSYQIEKEISLFINK